MSSASGVVPGRDEEEARGGGLASTRRDRSLIFRRKVLALSKSWWRHPKEEDNIWCCRHQQPTPPRPFAQPSLSAERRKLVFNYSCTHSPSYAAARFSSPLVLSYTVYRVATIRFIRPSLPSLFRISPELNLFLRHSICHAVLMNNELELWETKQNSFAFLKNVYTYIYVYRCCKSSRSAILRAHCRLYPKISSFIDERIHTVANVLYFSGTTSSAHESWKY